MELKLNGIEVECVIGDRPDERVRLQKLRVDLRLEIDDRVSESDELADTVDYVALAESVRGTLVRAECRMIERAARLAAEAAAEDPRVLSVSAEVVKTGAIPGLLSASAVYNMVKYRK